MHEYTIDGYPVICIYDERGHRVWLCGCANFDRRLLPYGNGFCVHTALAIERAIAGGQITILGSLDVHQKSR
jgi:hypothetical protein